MPRIDARIVLAPVLTGALLLTAWTAPRWSETSSTSSITVRTTPQLYAAGDGPAPARDAGYDVQVGGADPAREVRVDVWRDGSWVEEASAAADDEGDADLHVDDGVFARVVTEVDGSQVVTDFDPSTVGPPVWADEEFAEDADAPGPSWLTIPQPDDSGTCTEADDRASTVADGQLALSILEVPGGRCRQTGRPARLNGHLVYRAEIGYGTTAARIRLPESRSVLGQFWLQPGDDPGQRWVMDGDHAGVVIAETAGTDDDPRVATSLNTMAGGKVRAGRRVASAEDAPADGRFHVYALTWTPAELIFSVDGRAIRTVDATGWDPTATIGLSVLAPEKDLPPDLDQRTMYVDWLRVWAPS